MNLRRKSNQFVVAQFLLIAMFAVAVLVDPTPAPEVPDGVRILGLFFCAVGVVIIAAALLAMGRVMQVSPTPKESGHLVTRGIYRWMRHPMYTGLFLMVLGLALRRPTFVVIVVGVALVVLLLRKSLFEEQLLLERYPDYAAYRARTWGVIPFFR